jgi:hypothetical protein
MNAKFLEEAKLLENRWKKSGLLNGIKDRYSRQATAVLLEGQRLMNESCPDEGQIDLTSRDGFPANLNVRARLLNDK